MGDMRSCLPKMCSHCLQHLPHGCFTLEHISSLLINLNIYLDFLLHFSIDLLALYNLNQNVVDLRIKYFMLSVEVSIFDLQTISFKYRFIKLVFNTS